MTIQELMNALAHYPTDFKVGIADQENYQVYVEVTRVEYVASALGHEGHPKLPGIILS